MADIDTTTTLNQGSGGDKMDESLVTQSDATTTAKRPRVSVAFGADDGRGRLVDSAHPLPTTDERCAAALERIADDLAELKEVLFAFMED